MIKASKKVIATITSVTTTIIVGSTILANLAIKTTNKEDNNDKTNRGESYITIQYTTKLLIIDY